MTLEEQLLELGFIPFKKSIYTYFLEVKKDLHILVSITNIKTSVFISDINDTVTIFKSDYDGELKIEWIEKLVNLLK